AGNRPRAVRLAKAELKDDAPGRWPPPVSLGLRLLQLPRRALMPPSRDKERPVVLLAGGTGYVGRRLTPLLEQEAVQLRCLARTPNTLRRRVKQTIEIVQGDVLDPPSLDRSLQGVDTAFYLVHLMSGSKDFEKDARRAASNFPGAPARGGVGGLSPLEAWAPTATRSFPPTCAAATRSVKSCASQASRPPSSERPRSSARGALYSSW